MSNRMSNRMSSGLKLVRVRFTVRVRVVHLVF